MGSWPQPQEVLTFFSTENGLMFSMVVPAGSFPSERELAWRVSHWQRQWLVGTAFAPAPTVKGWTRHPLILEEDGE